MQHNPNSEFQIPNSNNKIFLIGMPAAGKTYWGKRLAEAYQLQFIDLDNYIAEQEKASIPALFAQYGETGFRERERKYLKQVISADTGNTVIACGGGTPCFYDNMAIMKQVGTVIYLQAAIESLIKNMEGSNEIRPLLKGKGDMTIHFAELLQKRSPIYEQAHFILHTKDISLITFDKIISECINKL